MWDRSRVVATAFVFFLVILAFQPVATSESLTRIPLANFKNGTAGIVAIESTDDYITVDLKAKSPDMIHIPIFQASNGAKVAKGVLQKDTMEREIIMDLVIEKYRGKPHPMIVLDQDWPQNWDGMIITLDEQDWPQGIRDLIIPLDFQDWPQSWLEAELK